MKTMILRGALVMAALTAFAASARAQTKPASTVEVGPTDVSDGSFKAGEYNGFDRQGAGGIGNIDWRGGSSGYNTDRTLRWRIKGNDLGLDTRSITAEIAQQGAFKLSFGFDQLRRNRSDTFQTPYLGAGTTTLTLPGSWLLPTVAASGGGNATNARGLMTTIGNSPFISTAAANNGALVSPSAAQIALVNAAAGADVPLFQPYNLFTKRTRFDAAFAYTVDPRWTVDASFRPEHKEGVKPMGTVSRNTGGDISTVIPDVIDNNHNQMNASVNFKGAKSFATAAYFGSYFSNNVTSMSWQNWATAAGTMNTISSAPSNNFNQFTFTAGANLTPTVKFVGTGSYGRTTQNDAFITDSTTPVVPVSSLNGLVITTAFSARLTAKPTKKLNLVAGYRYDNRDNQSAVHIFQYADAGEAPVANASFPAGPSNPLGPVLAQNANANRPYSRKLGQANAEADYGFAKREWIKFGYDFEKIDRGCTGTWIACVDADTTNEHTVRAEWRANAGDTFTARLGYAYGQRRTPNYNENAFLALVPYANVAPAAAIGGMSAVAFMNGNGWTGYGPSLGFQTTTGNMNLFFPSNNALANSMYANNNRISELPGMRRYYVADRNRDKVRGSLGWQANDALSFQGSLELNRDIYPNSTYGVQNSRGWAADVDGSYAITDDLTVSVSYTFEDLRALTAGNSYTANSNAATVANSQAGAIFLAGNGCDGYVNVQQRNNNNKLDPCLNWSANMVDRAHTVGFGLLKKIGNIDLTGNVILSRANWDNAVAGGSWVNNPLNGPGGAPTTIAAFFVPTTAIPTVTTNSGELRLSGKYSFDPRQGLRVSYSYLKMTSNDAAYDGMQFGTLSTQLPTLEQPFNYSVSVVGITYVLNF